MKKTTEVKTTLEGINSRLDEMENRINCLEDKVAENNQGIKKKKESKKKKRRGSLRGLWHNFKYTNICVIRGTRRRKEREQEIENLLEEILTENFPNLVKEIDIQVQEVKDPKQDEPKEAHTKTHHN